VQQLLFIKLDSDMGKNKAARSVKAVEPVGGGLEKR